MARRDTTADDIETVPAAIEGLRDYLEAAYEYIDAVPAEATRNIPAPARDPLPAGLDGEAEMRALQVRLATALRHIDTIPRAVVDRLAMPGFGRDEADALVAMDPAGLSPGPDPAARP
jgi:hypothetical protein